jgi:hypothetical protein
LQIAFCGFNLFRIDNAWLGQDLDDGAQERIFLFPLFHANAFGALNDDAHSLIDSLHPLDHYEGADFKKIGGLRVCVV